MDPAIIAAGISALSTIGGGFVSAGGAAQANAANAAINQQNIDYQMAQNNSNQTFANNVNVANWAYQDKVNAENFAFANQQTDIAQQFAQQQMDFQAQMSGTAYQRAMNDMKLAGLNPILAYQQGGASTPAGAAGSPSMATASGMAGQAYSGVAPKAVIPMVNTQGDLGRAIGNAATSAVDAYKNMTVAKQGKAQTDLVNQQNATEGYKQTNLTQDTQVKASQSRKLEAEADNARTSNDLIKAQIGTANANSAAAYADASNSASQAEFNRLRTLEAKPIDQGGFGRGTGVGSPTIERTLRKIEDNATIFGRYMDKHFGSSYPVPGSNP